MCVLKIVSTIGTFARVECKVHKYVRSNAMRLLYTYMYKYKYTNIRQCYDEMYMYKYEGILHVLTY